MASPKIQPFRPIVPMIYAYTTPDYPKNNGWIKIGYTERQSVQDRIRQQTGTVDIDTKLEWQDNAIYKDGSGRYFTDHDFHAWLEYKKAVQRRPGKEWFLLSPPESLRYFHEFASRKLPQNEQRSTFTLRAEQQSAVDKTRAWFGEDQEDSEFLWNAKPRFGKTLTAYALIQQMGFKKVLVVSNRPSISNSWAEDFYKFIGWQDQYSFVSDNAALSDKPGVLTRNAFLDDSNRKKGFIAFESLQGLKGSVYFGGEYDKLKWISDTEFDLLIVDESHEGVDTLKTERAFDNIKRRHTLYLSGTPFRQLAGGEFSEEQIFNWSYADEQEARENWRGEETNPYERMPRLNLFTYQLSPMIRARAEKGIEISEEEGAIDYAFDLNEFFATKENGKFEREEEVRAFLKALTTNEKYPFSTPELRDELAHTMWYLDRVASAKALAKLLAEDEIFKDYKVVVAAGDARFNEDAQNRKAIDQVKQAIKDNPKTITLTVGQLTVGITIPEWSAVLMLCNMKSPAAYMQAAFRAQNPYSETVNGQRLVKENAYVFDFDPARTLVIFDDFANNLIAGGLSGTVEDHKRNIMRLLNFLPVIGEDTDGKMVELDATQVLTIPRNLKSKAVVDSRFMSNLLFQNIGAIFNAPASVVDILNQLPMAREDKRKPDPERLAQIGQVPVDEKGEVKIPDAVIIGEAQGIFGAKRYEIIETASKEAEGIIQSETGDIGQKARALGDALKNTVKNNIIAPIAEKKGLKKGSQQKIEKNVEAAINRKVEKAAGDYEQAEKVAKVNLERERQEAESESERQEAQKKYDATLAEAVKAFETSVKTIVNDLVNEEPVAIIRQVETAKASEEKKSVEDEVRGHLRGFARTIPSFIMAYGDDSLSLNNFEKYVDADVFKEVAWISLDNFLFLRDGGDYTDKDTGKREHFEGHLFDEIVFNDSIREFLNRKRELANYFDPDQEGDIFDYIPPQKTNQIFTPKRMVKMMVDKLEEENPGCFEDPDATFADLYMKSGLYIAEIAKRLYRSQGLKKAFPDGDERIRHILEKQLYGIAPSRIIYLIATNYLLGFDEKFKAMNHNFVEADTVQAAKAGQLDALVDKEFK